jgi:hypothetical protein
VPVLKVIIEVFSIQMPFRKKMFQRFQYFIRWRKTKQSSTHCLGVQVNGLIFLFSQLNVSFYILFLKVQICFVSAKSDDITFLLYVSLDEEINFVCKSN